MTKRSVRPSHAGGPGSALGRVFARLLRPAARREANSEAAHVKMRQIESDLKNALLENAQQM